MRPPFFVFTHAHAGWGLFGNKKELALRFLCVGPFDDQEEIFEFEIRKINDFALHEGRFPRMVPFFLFFKCLHALQFVPKTLPQDIVFFYSFSRVRQEVYVKDVSLPIVVLANCLGRHLFMHDKTFPVAPKSKGALTDKEYQKLHTDNMLIWLETVVVQFGTHCLKEGHANFPSLLEDLHARLQVLAGQGPADDDSNDSTYEEATLLEPAKKKSKAATSATKRKRPSGKSASTPASKRANVVVLDDSQGSDASTDVAVTPKMLKSASVSSASAATVTPGPSQKRPVSF